MIWAEKSWIRNQNGKITHAGAWKGPTGTPTHRMKRIFALHESNEECAHDAGDGARGTDQRCLELRVPDREHHRGHDTRRQKETCKEGSPPDIFNEWTDHEEEDHVEDQVQPSGVHELVGDQSVEMKPGRHQPEKAGRRAVEGFEKTER